MRVKKVYIYPILIVALLCSWSFTVLGAEPTIIKVGLESVYKNVSSITLSSDTQMEIGYMNEEGFVTLGNLDGTILSISKQTNQYFDTGSIYNTYQEAVEAARTMSGIPIYIDQGLFGVYTTTSVGTSVANSATRYEVKNEKGQVILLFNKGSKDLVFRGYSQENGLHLTGVGTSKKYRGAIGIGGTTGITPYNIVNIEEYLYGVVPCEMPASWPEEALKTQAVAARSIATYQYNRYLSSGYNVVDTTTTQVYGGYTREDSRTTAAVDATKGEKIRYNGKVAEALYFSTSGGYTESAENVWGNPISYLVAVADNYETEPAQADWTRTITLAEINQCLSNNGINIGSAQGVQIISRTQSGRVKEMNILGTTGQYTLTLEKIRTFFSSTNGGALRSRLFSLVGATSNGSASTGSSKTITVLSASGTRQLAVDEMIVTDGKSTHPIIGDYINVQSATDETKIEMSQSTEVGSTTAETIYGDVTFSGKGYGHGVGMSQSGAKGMAKAGFSYIEILKHYYQGVTIE